MKSHKKGYTLATTLVVMVLVFAISSVMISLVAGQSRLGKQNAQIFETNLAVMQICSNFVNMPFDEFKDYYQNLGYSATINNTQTTWFNPDKAHSIVVEENGQSEQLWVVQYSKNVSLANVQKSLGQVVSWTYEEKEFEL